MNEKIPAYFCDELSQPERVSLLREIESDEALKKQFTEYQNMHALLNLGHQIENRVVGQQKYNQFITRKQHVKIHKLGLRWLGYAATVLILMTSSALLTFWYARSTPETDLLANVVNTLYTPAGQRAQLMLHDGTEVWLNAGSKLIYPALFTDDERRVSIEGEAFFRVAKDPSKPFIVSTPDVDIKALGTQFNVYSYAEAGYIRTSLLEGSVKVFFPDKEQEGVILSPNQQITIYQGEMKVEPIRLNEHFLWRNGIYAFENEPLINILKKMELYYDIQIIINDASIFNDTYTGKFRQRDSLDDVFRILQQIRNFKVKKNLENNIITLSK